MLYYILYPQTAGLNEIVPDNLLSIFDENELEVSGLLQVNAGYLSIQIHIIMAPL